MGVYYRNCLPGVSNCDLEAVGVAFCCFIAKKGGKLKSEVSFGNPVSEV